MRDSYKQRDPFHEDPPPTITRVNVSSHNSIGIIHRLKTIVGTIVSTLILSHFLPDFVPQQYFLQYYILF